MSPRVVPAAVTVTLLPALSDVVAASQPMLAKKEEKH